MLSAFFTTCVISVNFIWTCRFLVSSLQSDDSFLSCNAFDDILPSWVRHHIEAHMQIGFVHMNLGGYNISTVSVGKKKLNGINKKFLVLCLTLWQNILHPNRRYMSSLVLCRALAPCFILFIFRFFLDFCKVLMLIFSHITNYV